MRKNSLSKEKDIVRALRGKPFFSKFFTIKVYRRSNNNDHRYTVIVSKKVLKLAVDRNKFKRRVRSVVVAQQGSINSGVDFVVIAKKGIENAEFSELKSEIIRGLERLKII